MKHIFTLFNQSIKKPLLLACALLAMSGNAWGKSKTFYSKCVVKSQPAAGGYVYVAKSGQTSVDYKLTDDNSKQDGSSTWFPGFPLYQSEPQSKTFDFYAYQKANDGYSFSGWNTDENATSGSTTTENYNEWFTDYPYYPLSVRATSTNSNSPTTTTYYAIFTPHTYTIKFDANNENASGNTSEMSCTYDEDAKSLSANGFSLVGYTFSGWNTKDDGTGTSYTDKQNVNNLTTDDNVDVILYAQWTPNTYTITFNGNNNSSGSMTDQVFTYDVPQNLKSNAYARKYTVTYNANGGDCSKSSEDATFTFDGWSTVKDGDRVYTDAQANLKNLTAENGKKIELFARWTGGRITLPVATKEGKVFDGWYIGDATDPIGTDGSEYAPTANVTLVAHWTDIASPRYTWNGETTYLVGDASLDLDNLWISGNKGTEKQFTLVSFTPAAGNHSGATAPSIKDKKLSLGQAGDIVVRVTQEAATYYLAGEAELTIHVDRHPNTILVKGEENYRKAIEIDSYDTDFTFTATNTDYTNYPISVEQIEGLNIATYYPQPDKRFVYSARISGEAAWQVSQAETYYYEGATNVFYIDVRLAEEVTCYILENQSDEKGEKLGRTTHEHTWTEENVAGVVSFDVCYNSGIAFDQAYAVEQYLNGEWKNLTGKRTDISTSYQTKTFKLNPAAKGVRFWASGSVQDKFKNVSVTRYTYLNLSEESFTFDKTNDNKPIYNNVEVSKTFTINYSMPQNGTQINISSTHPAFKVSPTKLSNTGCKSSTNNVITVTYSSDEAGTHEGKIVVNNEVFYKEIAVIGTTIKKDQTITWEQNQDVKTTDNLVLSATSDSELAVEYTVVEGSAATVDKTTGAVTIITEGDVTFRATQPGNKYFYAAKDVDLTFTISKVTPTITTNPTASDVLLPATLATSTLTGGSASVEGSFAWQNTSTAVERNNTGYTVVFTPTNTNWYTTQTCTVVVGIEKYVPEITTNELVCSEITYGQTLESSLISGNLVITDIIPDPTEAVSGTIAWKNKDYVPSVGESATVVFTADDDTWFLPVEISLPVTVNPVSAKTYAATATISEGQTFADAILDIQNGTIGLDDETVEGEFSWNTSVEQDLVPEEGTYELSATFTSHNANYLGNSDVRCTVTVDPATVWDGSQPEDNDERVITNSDVVVTGTITLGGLTINAGNTVTVKDGATLNIGDNNSLNRATYGNIIVEAGGKLNIGTGEVKVNDFTLHSGFGGDNAPKSGQVSGHQKLTSKGNAYFVLDLDSEGAASYGWYSFTVPFPVDALRGITRYENGAWQTITNEVNYAIMDYHEDLRAQGKYGWKKYRGVLRPGVGYLMTVENAVNTYRFKMIDGGAFNANMQQALTASEGDGVDNGWNSIGNGTMSYVTYNEKPRYAQLLNHKDNSYEIIRTESYNFVVGAAYFVQATANSTIVMRDASAATTGLLRAPERQQEGSDICDIDLSLRANGKTCDRLFVTCDEEATMNYTIGRDVQKMGTTTGASVARMWANAKGSVLGAVDMPFSGDKTIIPMSLYAPKAGEYTIAIDNNPTEDIYLTRDGVIVWDLSMSDYTLDLNAGTDNTYALLVTRRVKDTATGIDALDSDNRGTDFVVKKIVNGQLFILRDGVMYDAQGKKVTTF